MWTRQVSIAKTRGRGRNVIGNIMCASISKNGVLQHHAILGPYNTAHITFLDNLHNRLLIPNNHGPEQPRYVIIWDNVSFHWAALVSNWFTGHPPLSILHTLRS
ncbi:hypothetical protein N1851_029266 [Merluccius polli]|uniref:Tc1-like transposase DDE domain-containing protein n=1 Tax=Merluccius polli TaxID=89951 RepID=A0AA47M779_MERPO|nr:hypothetical protein N1851_029266 [Merluccius polli]